MLYVYSDPKVCNCLYVGNQAAYGRYMSYVQAQNLADQQQMTADMPRTRHGTGACGAGVAAGAAHGAVAGGNTQLPGILPDLIYVGLGRWSA